MRNPVLTGYLLSVLMLFSSALSAETAVWVAVDGAALRENRVGSSKVIARLQRGEKLTVIDRQRRWFNVVSTVGDEGWVYKGKISIEPVGFSATKKPRAAIFPLLNVHHATSSRSIRGLVGEEIFAGSEHKQYREKRKQLEWVLGLEITQEDIEQFLEIGEIGEYAK